MSESSDEVIRNFTAARKFPQLIGRTPDGKRIIGGPYTVTQAVGAGIAIAFLYLTRSWWTGFGLTGAVFFAAAVLVGTIMGLGRLRPGGRNPISLAQGIARSLTTTTPPPAPVSGHPRGIRLPVRPHTVRAAAYIWPDTTFTAGMMAGVMVPRTWESRQ